MAGDVDVLGQVNYLDVWNHDRFLAKLQREPVHGRRCARAVGVRDLTAAVPRPGHDGRSAAVSCGPSAAASSWTARSASAATRARCSKPARRASSASIAISTRSRIARETLAPWGDRVELVHADYRAIDAVLDGLGVTLVDGALADLGVSSLQFDAPGRGFSFQRDEPLDMRMDRSRGETAADLVARSSEQELADAILRIRRRAVFAPHRPRHRRRAARGADRHHAAPGGDRPPRGADARLSAHRSGDAHVPGAAHLGEPRARRARRLSRRDGERLRAGARLVVISFHSLEDRIVKHTFRALERSAPTRR